jgi:hypothetical protein
VKGGLNFGSVTALGRGGIDFYSNVFKQVESYAPDQVAAVYFARLEEPPPEPDALLAIVIGVDGSTLRGIPESFADGTLRLRTLLPAPRARAGDGAAAPAEGKPAPLVLGIPAGRISAVCFKNGDVVHASDLDPVRTDEYPLLIRPAKPSPHEAALFRFRKDRSVEGNPLRIAGREFRKGLGVHARSELVFAAAGRYRTFAATIGIDDERGGAGSGRFIVQADGKAVFQTEGPLRGGAPGVDIRVPVAGAREVTLLVEFGDDGGVHAHADWGGARFLK